MEWRFTDKLKCHQPMGSPPDIEVRAVNQAFSYLIEVSTSLRNIYHIAG